MPAIKKKLPKLTKNYYTYNNHQGPHHSLAEIGKTIEMRNFRKSVIVGSIAGLFFSQLLIFSIAKLTSVYQYNESSHKNQNYVREDKTLANQLYNEVRVLCWIMTGPGNHETKAQHVKNTWGQRCNKLLFMSSEEDSKLGTIALPVSEGRHELWGKTKEAFKYIYEHHLNEYEWFLKADDDTYVVVENLRKMLYEYDTEFPIFLGSRRRETVKQGFMHGGAGYVLSKQALKRFNEQGLHNESICRQNNGGLEDIELARCMEKLEVLAGDSRDEYERGRMFPHTPRKHLIDPYFAPRYWKNFYYKSEPSLNCCSDHAISFHYIEPNRMYELDYLIYNLRPFGITPGVDILPEKKSLDELSHTLRLPSINAK